MTNWHTLPINEALNLTESQLTGLSAAQSAEQLQKHGRNELVEKRKKSVWRMFLLQFKDLMILILIAAALVAGLLGDKTDAIVILVIVVLNAIFGFVQEYRAEKAMLA
jgi:P-type Ca2+ transporter type 2C